MSKNLYERKIRYSFVETQSVVASSQEEADAKFAQRFEADKLTPVGCSYGDLEAEMLSNELVYKDDEEPKGDDNGQ